MTLKVLFFACHYVIIIAFVAATTTYYVDMRPKHLSTSPDFPVFPLAQRRQVFTIEEQGSEHTHYPESIDDNSIIQKNDIHATKDTLKCSGIMLNVMH